jgi:hypothetical protein
MDDHMTDSNHKKALGMGVFAFHFAVGRRTKYVQTLQ